MPSGLNPKPGPQGQDLYSLFKKSRFFNQLNLLKSKIMPSFNAFALLIKSFTWKILYDYINTFAKFKNGFKLGSWPELNIPQVRRILSQH
jgi:hypothetical protein